MLYKPEPLTYLTVFQIYKHHHAAVPLVLLRVLVHHATDWQRPLQHGKVKKSVKKNLARIGGVPRGIQSHWVREHKVTSRSSMRSIKCLELQAANKSIV